MTHDTYALPKGTILHGKSFVYQIDKVLGQGSFGITYLASIKINGALGSIDANVKVTVKEFFMANFNGRQGCTVTSGSQDGMYGYYKHKFTQEAINLSKLHHPNIVNVLEAFEENNTVYYAMEYIDGGSLDKKIEQNQKLSEKQCMELTKQIGSAVSFMHDNMMLHLDLKPSNIMLKQNGDAVLIDFGLSKQYTENGEPETLTKVGGGTPGYAPLEQISYRDGKGFPATMDVYALGGTMYKMLTGVRPPEASDILEDGFPLHELTNRNVSEHTAVVIAKAMMPKRSERYQSVMDMIKDLSSESPASHSSHQASKEESTIREKETLLPMPESISIKLNRRGHGLSYEIYMNSKTCNTVYAYYDEEEKVDEDFYGGIYDDVKKHLEKNGFLDPQHWENESSTTPIAENFGYDISVVFYYADGKSFSRHVKHAHPDWHSRLLDAVEKLVKETSLKKQVDQVATYSDTVPVEIRKDTSRVDIVYKPFGPNWQGFFDTHISPKNTKGIEGIFTPQISQKQFERFLNELDQMSLREKCAYKSFNQFDFSEPPETLIIRLLDKQGECYKELSQQYIARQVYGNLAGEIKGLRSKIIEITPQLKEHLRREEYRETQQESKSGFSFFGLFKKK